MVDLRHAYKHALHTLVARASELIPERSFKHLPDKGGMLVEAGGS